MAKTIKTRVLLKTDFTENWNKAANSFIPKEGEVCIYLDRIQLEDGSYIPGIKVGDGTSYINELEFINDDYITNAQIDALFGSNLIKFYVSNKEFICEEGMTWIDFIDSKYNSEKLFTKNNITGASGTVRYNSTSGGVLLMNVIDTNIIIANYNYRTETAEPN